MVNGEYKQIGVNAPEDVNLDDMPQLPTISPGVWYPNNTAGAAGFSLRDLYPGLTDKWYNDQRRKRRLVGGQ